MKTEVRVTSVARMEPYLELDGLDAISLGNEGCAYKVPDAKTFFAARERAESFGKACVLVTPLVPPTQYDAMVRLINEVADAGPATVVVNDWGLLHGTQACWGEGRLRPIAGISLSLCGERVVGGKTFGRAVMEFIDKADFGHELVDQYDWVRKNLIQNTFHSRERIRFVKEHYGLAGLEEGLCPSAAPSLERIRSMGLEVRIQAGRTAVALTRACAIARYHNQQPPDCDALCEESVFLTASKLCRIGVGMIWDDAHEQDILSHIPEFHVLGNVQYKAAPETPEDMALEAMDWVIFDARAFSPLRLKELVGLWKSLQQEVSACTN